MSKNTTIKVSKKTLEKLHRLAGELAKERSKRVTLEEAINYLLEEKQNALYINSSKSIKLRQDRKKFLELLEETVEGAGPDDFKEYDFEDIGV
jgi:hypothetical protein